MNKTISVIIPMYNAEGTIKKALDSVVNQTYKGKFEIIVINDGSKDNSLEIVEEYKKANISENISVKIINKKNGGVSSARNRGLEEATGEYIALLDSDDEWLINKTEAQIKILEKNPEIDFLGCNRNNEVTRILFKKYSKLFRVNLNQLLIKTFPQTSCAIFKNDVIKNVGFYDENQKYAEDGNYWLRICTRNNFYMMPESLVITGDWKPNFGFSGLSQNLKEMERGNLKNLKEIFELGYIGSFKYFIIRIFYFIKYMRRILISKGRRV